MGTTPNYAWPYPELTSPPDGAGQIKALANAIDTTMKATRDGVPAVQTGFLTMTITAATSVQVAITWPRAFAAKPSACGNINALSATMIGWTIRVASITTTGANLLLTGGSAQTYTPEITWIAALNPTTPFMAALARPPPEPGWHYANATCRTPDCPKADELVGDLLIPDSADDWAGVYCGVCAQLAAVS